MVENHSRLAIGDIGRSKQARKFILRMLCTRLGYHQRILDLKEESHMVDLSPEFVQEVERATDYRHGGLLEYTRVTPSSSRNTTLVTLMQYHLG